MKFQIAALGALVSLVLVSPLQAQDSPEAAYQKWVAASKAGDIQALLAISSAEKVKEFHEEFKTPEKQEEIRKLMKLMAPITYKIKMTEVSPDGNKASLFLDSTALDFFSLNDPKAKPQKEEAEVRLVKEGGQWKIAQQCVGKDGCGKEPEWTKISWGKAIPLANGATIKFRQSQSGPVPPGLPSPSKPFAVEMDLQLPEGSQSFSYFLHRSPSFADFYLKIGEQKFTPVARTEDFPPVPSTEVRKPDTKILEENFSYSRSTGFTGKGSLKLFFDLPKDATGPKVFYAIFTYGEQKYSFEVK